MFGRGLTLSRWSAAGVSLRDDDQCLCLSIEMCSIWRLEHSHVKSSFERTWRYEILRQATAVAPIPRPRTTLRPIFLIMLNPIFLNTRAG